MYYGASICLVSFASAMAVVTLNIHHRGVRGNQVSPWVRKLVFGFLSYIVGIHFDRSINESRERTKRSAEVSTVKCPAGEKEKQQKKLPTAEGCYYNYLLTI